METSEEQREELRSSTECAEEGTKDATINTRKPRKWLRRLLFVLFLVPLLIGVGAWYLYSTTQSEPEFYRKAIAQPLVELEEGGDQFETKIIELQNAARGEGKWIHSFTETEVNGWLAIDCPEKFPDLIPSFIKDPRVRLRESEVSLVFRYQRGNVKAVVTLVADIFVTEPINDIAIRIKSAKSGLLPLPISEFADKLSRHMRRNGVAVRWLEEEGDPMMLLGMPKSKMKLDGRAIEINSISLLDKQLEVSGKTLEEEKEEVQKEKENGE